MEKNSGFEVGAKFALYGKQNTKVSHMGRPAHVRLR